MGTAEVESALVAHPKVSEAAVVGYPHDIKGQGIYAYVTLNAGEETSDELYKELVAWVRKEIGPIASPDLIQWAPGLPKTRSGKIKTNLEVRFKKRLADKKTFFEEGMLKYWTSDSKGNDNISYLEFEAVWIKRGKEWLMIMENQKSFLDEIEWNKLE